MSVHQRTPVQQLRHDQSSYVSESPYRQTQFAYQIPKIDHAFIIQNYRRLRIQQRDQLAKLRMPDNLKRKIFDFKQEQDLQHTKPQLVIFNHPFRGKMVLTKSQVQKQLQRQRKNAQLAMQFKEKGEKVPQKIFNEMGLQQEELELKKNKMVRQPSSKEENYPKKPRLISDQTERKIAQDINKQQQKHNEGKMYFIQKNKEHEETEKQKDRKMQKLMDEKQSKSRSKANLVQQNSPDSKEIKPKSTKNIFKDMPVIGQEPKVVRDIKFDQLNTVVNHHEDKVKELIRPLEKVQKNRQTESKQSRGNRWIERQNQIGSGSSLVKKKIATQNGPFLNDNEKSISQISAIPSNDKDIDYSDAQSLNKGLFME